MTTLRSYRESDLPAVQRVWRECGWVDDDDGAAAIAPFMADADALVATIDGEAEACVSVHRGTLLHTGTDLDLAAVTSVTTSRVARRQGLARRLLAAGLADAADDGAAVAVLGMFEQGFYDTLGFGTGAEMLFHRFDPATLDAGLPNRRPVRLGPEHAGEMAAAMARRSRAHGGVVLPQASLCAAEMGLVGTSFGLGLRGAEGRLTHFVFGRVDDEHGPYRVSMWAFRDAHDLRELLGLVASLGDQVRTVVLPEPAQAQLQVLVRNPGRQEIARTSGPHRAGVSADTWWQARILDLPACLAALRTAGPQVAFDLVLVDPAGRWLPGDDDEGDDDDDSSDGDGDENGSSRPGDDGAEQDHDRADDDRSDHASDEDHADNGDRARRWSGVGGEWHVRLGPDGSSAERGLRDAALRLTCGVGTFTRLWLGVRSASVLAATDDLEASDELLEQLDAALRLPRPDVGMDF